MTLRVPAAPPEWAGTACTADAPLRAITRPTPIDGAAGARHHALMLIYKVLRPEEWAALQTDGRTPGAPIDRSDGFVHFSTAAQTAETLAKHFAGAGGLMLLACETGPMGDDLKWEVSRGGALFPHLYRDLRMDDVAWHRPIGWDGNAHVLPEGME